MTELGVILENEYILEEKAFLDCVRRKHWKPQSPEPSPPSFFHSSALIVLFTGALRFTNWTPGKAITQHENYCAADDTFLLATPAYRS